MAGGAAVAAVCSAFSDVSSFSSAPRRCSPPRRCRPSPRSPLIPSGYLRRPISWSCTLPRLCPSRRSPSPSTVTGVCHYRLRGVTRERLVEDTPFGTNTIFTWPLFLLQTPDLTDALSGLAALVITPLTLDSTIRRIHFKNPFCTEAKLFRYFLPCFIP